MIGNYPKEVKKSIILAAPHTSNWDFPLGILVRSVGEFQSNYVIKDSWLKQPIIGSMLKKMGGVGVDRSRSMKMTDRIAELFKEREHFVITIAPEGTRKYNPDWKTGFWYIAQSAEVPIVPVGFDYGKKQIVWGEPFYTTDDQVADFEELKRFFKQFKGKYPQQGVL